MAVVGTGLSQVGIRGEFFAHYHQVATYWQELATTIKSTTNVERYAFLGSVPPMREWGTGRLARGLNAESYDVENERYEITIEVDRQELEDDQLGQISLRTREMAEKAADHKDFLIEQLIKNGESSGFHSYDGVPFFSENHVSHQSGEQSNLLTSPATDADNPTAAEFRTAFQAAIAQMVQYKDDTGQPRRIKPTGLVAVVPATMLFTAMQALDVQIVPHQTSVYQTNVIQGAAKVIALPGLTDASKWYLLKTDGQIRPFIFQDRVPIEFTALDAESDEGFMRDKFLYGVRARYAMTYGYWFNAVRTAFVQ